MAKTLLAAFTFLVSSLALADEQAASAFVSSVGQTTLDRSVSAPSGIEVTAGKGASTASIRLSRQLSSGSDAAPGSKPNHTFGTWSLTASAPLNKSSDDTDVATLDGLVNAANIELKFSQFSVPDLRKPNFEDPRTVAVYDSICAEMRMAVIATGKDEKAAKEVECDLGNVKKYVPSRHGEYRSLYWDPKGLRVVWGASAKLGYQKFDFVNTASLSQESQDEAPWAIGVFIGLNPTQWRTLFTLTAQYQEAYKDSKNGVQCPGGGGPVTCVSGPLGSPKRSIKKLLSLEARKEFGWMSASLTTTFDFEADTLGLDLPIYLVKDKDGKLGGGIRMGWRDDTNDFTAGVFVGAAFGLFK